MRALTLIASLALLAGCASRDRSPTTELAPGRYAAAFAAAKETLAHTRFELDRVDARGGVITTKPKPTSGLATPWDTEQSSPGQEIEDLLNRQYRRVRVSFEPATDPATGDPPEVPADFRESGEPLVCTVTVSVERLRRPGWRVETTSIRLSSVYYDPAWAGTDTWPSYTVPFAQDHRLAARLAAGIRERLAGKAGR